MNGLWFGMQVTPVPSRMFFVLPRAFAMNRSGAGIFSHTEVKCSPIPCLAVSEFVEDYELLKVVLQCLRYVCAGWVQGHRKVAEFHERDLPEISSRYLYSIVD